jgi:hypothetical protein
MKFYLGGAILFALPLFLTSCEGTLDDIFGEWSRPSGNTNTNSGSDSTPAASSNYMAWNGTALAAEAIPSDAKEVTAATEKLEGGTYIVKSDVTCNSINVTADSKLILCDGAKLTINGYLEDQTATPAFNLYIYGQENQTGKLIVSANDANAIWAKNIEIHGGDIDAKAVTGGFVPNGVKTYNDLAIYGGTVKTTGGDADATYPGAAGIDCGGNLTIKGEAIVKAYGGAKSGSLSGGIGINVGGTIDITGNADVYCKGRDNHSLYAEGNIVLSATKVEAESPVADGYGSGIFSNTGDITISGGTVIAASGVSGYGIIASNNLVINGGTVTATSNSLNAIRGATSINITTGVNKVEMINPSASSDPTVAQAFKFASTGDTTITLGGVDTNYTTWNGYKVSDAIGAYPKLSYDGTTKTLTYNPN